MISKADAIRVLEFRIERADKTLAKFAEDLSKDPAYAFEWGKDAVSAAATKRVCARVLGAFSKDPELSMEFVISHLQDRVISGAHHSYRSTSYLANEMAREELAAQAELVVDFT